MLRVVPAAAELGKESPSPLETFLNQTLDFFVLPPLEGGVCVPSPGTWADV